MMIERYFVSICGSNLWDPKAIYSENPDFTFCFEYSLLIWIPCFFIWFASPLWIFKITKNNKYLIKISWLTWTKTFLITVLITLQIIELTKAFTNDAQTFTVFYMTPLVLISTYVLVMFILHYERINGWRHSTILFIFWLLLTMATLVMLRSKILRHMNRASISNHTSIDNENTLFELIIYVINTLSILTCLLLSTVSERRFVDMNTKMNRSPEYTSPLLSQLTFWWINSLINTGYKRELKREDLWEIDYRDQTELNTTKLENEWNPKALDYINKARSLEAENEKTINGSIRKVIYSKENGKENGDDEQVKLTLNGNEHQIEVKTVKKLREPSLGLCLVKIFSFKFFGIVSIKLSHVLLDFARPILLDKLITFVKEKDQKLTVGVFFIFLLCLTSFIQTLIMQHYYQSLFLVGHRIKISLMNIIYKKSLSLSTSAKKSTTVGEMTNLITSDAQVFEHGIFQLVGIFSTPIQIVISTYMLYKYLGVATFAGVASIIFFLPMNGFFAKKNKSIRKAKAKFQDSRVKIMNEILSGIRVIKFYGWELSFKKIVEKFRTKEINCLIKSELLSALSSFTWNIAPFVVAAVSFAVYLLIDKKNVLDPNKIFVSLTLFNMLRFPLNSLPHLFQRIILINVSMTRIRKFLLKDEINLKDINHDDIDGFAVTVKNVNFGWSRQDVLRNLNFEVKKGQLVAILGKVGSGKSSLLSGLLGEMEKLNSDGVVNINGSTAYVPQQAWIQNATVKNNILFNLEYDEKYYNKVVEFCCLQTDLQIMPSGDQTEIGEKGINLSGGQKQRVSLARALYSNADIYMLDDPLSAVDAHVGKNIFDKVIGPNGMLRNKTRLFVTNSLSFLPQCDQIIMIDDGCIVEIGTYEELLSKDNIFTDFIKNFLESKEANQELIKNINADNIDDNDEVEEDEKISVGFERLVSTVSETKRRKESNHSNKQEHESLLEKKNDGRKIIEKEKIETGNIKLAVILEYFKACKLTIFALFLILNLSSSGLDMATKYWLSDWSNEANDLEKAQSSKFYRLGIYIALGISKSSNLSYVAMFIIASQYLHSKLLYSVLRCGLRFFESTPMGRIVNRFTKDIQATENAIPNSIESLIDCFLSLSSTVIIISSSTPYFLIALIPITIFYIFVQRYFVPSNRQLKRLQSASKSPIFSHFSESQAGVTTIRAYKVQGKFIESMQKFIDEFFVYQYSNTVSNRWLAIRLEMIGNAITIIAALFAILSRDTLSAGMAGLSISISLNISSTLNWFVRTMSDFEANITSMERIKEYIELKQEPEWSIEKTKPFKSWPDKGNIKFMKYFIKYRDDLDFVLSDLNLDISSGEKIGIVGRTGAGKSSLTLGLFRMIEIIHGDIVIDNVNIKEIGLHDLRHKLTIIPQDPIIFSGTIKSNLDPFQIYTDDELMKALELAHLKDFVLGLENQLEFECSEGGENLSVGQRQLICLARALLRKTKILILDEATASIDHNTDELIQQTIRTQFVDCTVLTIAHRLNTIMDSSRILVLDRGKIVEFDSPKMLLSNKNGLFYSMAKQAGLISN